MANRVLYSDKARRSLLEIALHVAERDPDAALRLVDDLRQRLDDVLRVFPEAGARAGKGNRFLVIRRHSAIYRYDVERREVIVLDVFGPGRDWR
jgi:plasmid stabilization system protein ParE